MSESNGNGTDVATITEAQFLDSMELLQERISELELSLEDQGWQRLGGDSGLEFSREALRRIAALSRLAFLKNPLINRAVTLQSMYVWGQGVTIEARHPAVDAVVQSFLDDHRNRAELTSHQARVLKEQDLQVEGNLFFVFFANPLTGRLRVRTIPPGEIADIVCNPEDAKEPWYYQRIWTQSWTESTGVRRTQQKVAFYPDWRHRPRVQPTMFGEHAVEWASPVYHVKVGGLSDMRFGVPETYQAIDWARTYKSFLENVATIMQALSRFAGKLTTKGRAKGVAAAKARLGTTLATGGGTETNPPPVAGSMLIAGEGVDYTPFQLRGASIAPEDGRRFLLMVAAATGWPETFFGDVSVGTLATAKSLDRPSELRMKDRQTLWADVLGTILGHAIDWAVRAPNGPLNGLGSATVDVEGELVITLGNDPETDQPIDRGLTIAFPSILEHDVGASVDAIVKAATLGGQGTLAGTLDVKLTTRMLLTALGVEHVDEVMAQLFPEGEPTTNEPPAPTDEPPAGEEGAA